MSNNLTVKQNSTTPAVPGFDRELAILLASALNKLEQFDGETVTTELLGDDVKRELQVRASALMVAIKPGDQRLMVAEILEMLSKFLNAKPVDCAKTAVAFAMELTDLPLFAVERACRDISGGRVSDLNPDFPPSAARLRQVAETYVTPIFKECSDIRKVLQAKLKCEMTDEVRERIGLKLKTFGAEFKASIEKEQAPRKNAHAEFAAKASQSMIASEYERAGVEPASSVFGTPSLGLMRLVVELKANRDEEREAS